MPVPSSISELSQTAGSNFPAGSESPISADDYLRTYASFIAVLRDGKGLSAEVDVASAATCDIGAANSPFVRITGTTTITSFGTNYNGPRFIRFGGALTLTHNASSLILPGAANITTGAGDTCIAVPIGASGWQVYSYQFAGTAVIPMGECRLTKSGSNLLLSPFNGNKLTIGGVNQTIPSAGVTLAPTSLTGSTLYYIYAYMNAGTMTLEASTTARATDTATGLQIKNGDASRTLVGMARTSAGVAWADSADARHVRSWFNRQRLSLAGAVATTRTTTSTSLTEINTETRAFFLCWSDETPYVFSTGWCVNSGANETGTAVGVDGTTTKTPISTTFGTSGGPVTACGLISGLSEANHYITLLGAVSAGTGSWVGNAGGYREAVTIGGWVGP